RVVEVLDRVLMLLVDEHDHPIGRSRGDQEGEGRGDRHRHAGDAPVRARRGEVGWLAHGIAPRVSGCWFGRSGPALRSCEGICRPSEASPRLRCDNPRTDGRDPLTPTTGPVLMFGLDDALADELSREEGLVVARAADRSE